MLSGSLYPNNKKCCIILEGLGFNVEETHYNFLSDARLDCDLINVLNDRLCNLLLSNI